MKLVMVEWLDACSYYTTNGWLSKEDKGPKGFKPVKCITAGLLYLDGSDSIVVLLNQNNKGRFCQAQTIPRSCITRIRQLTVK